MSCDLSDKAGSLAIKVENVSKTYSIFRRPFDRLTHMLSFGKVKHYDVFQALDDVSLTVNYGETVGIVGSNGCGKSTLLQIIAGLITPNSCEVSAGCRIAAILELGAGFNPDFTGRENIYLNASIHGLDRREIDDRFGSIVEFSWLGDFIERPVGTYSSGMYVRLAFSIAASIEPDILIIDEALAVGDERFQRKCLARIEYLQQRGAAILFVSHSMALITQLCTKALLLDAGQLLMTGDPKTVAANYYRLVHAAGDIRNRVRSEIVANASQKAEAVEVQLHSGFNDDVESESRVEYEGQGGKIEDPRIETLDGERVNQLVKGERYVVRYRAVFSRAQDKVRFGFLFKTKIGIELAGRATAGPNDPMPDYAAGSVAEVRFEFTCNFLSGIYFINVGMNANTGEERRSIHRIMDAVMFEVLPIRDETLSGIIDIGIQASAKNG